MGASRGCRVGIGPSEREQRVTRVDKRSTSEEAASRPPWAGQGSNCDLVINSPLLYQLSYRPELAPV